MSSPLNGKLIMSEPNGNLVEEPSLTLTSASEPLVHFGVITDVQYADNADKPAWYDHSKTRYYRSSLDHVSKAFNVWKRKPKQLQQPQFVLQLGDIIDGLNRKCDRQDTKVCDSSLSALRKALDRFEENMEIPTFHAVGNHELYNFKRTDLARLFQESLLKRMKINTHELGLDAIDANHLIPSNAKSADDQSLYYKFTPHPQVKVIALDCFDISVVGYDSNHDNYKKAAEILYQYHGHDDWDGWDLDHHLTGLERRFQSSNGMVSQEQLSWLEQELSESDAAGQLVIVFGHIGIHPDSCDSSCLMWNYQDVIDCFSRHPSVVAYFCGHTHNQGYAVENGVHYVVYHGIIETSPEDEAFATVTLFDDRLEIEGFGLEKSRSLPIVRKTTVDVTVNDGEDVSDVESIFGMTGMTAEEIMEAINEESMDGTVVPTVQVQV